jgi:serine/threonine protein kinase
MLEPRTVINECYILQECIGKDSFCELWRATAIYTATQLLLRFVNDTPNLSPLYEDFRNAAFRCYRVADPAVADFVEVERFGDRIFIASEYSGELPMTMALAPDSQLGLEHICRFVMEMARGLDAFHGQGIVYGCLNPENVLIYKDSGVIRGIRVQKPGYMSLLPGLDKDDENAVWENYGYMAPEVKAGGKPDERSDVYCLGVHLVRLLTGDLPLPLDAQKARQRSVSLEYVANALTRRAVPAAVIKIALRALRRDPALRYPACVDLMAELRAFVDERRLEFLRSGRNDPLAELEALNRGFARHGQAAEAVRVLDTADYFRALSEAVPEPPRPEMGLGFPVRDFEDPAAVQLIESQEIEGKEDDGTLSIERILEQSRRTVSQERGSRRLSLEALPQEPEKSLQQTAAFPEEDVVIPVKPLEPAAAVVKAPEVVDVPEEVEDYIPELPVADTIPPLPEADPSGVRWSHITVLPEEVVEEMAEAFRKTFHGRGTFRFIQEPRDSAVAGLFAELFSRFRYEGFFVDAGSLAPNSPTIRMDVTDFIRAARASIARALLGEPPASVRYLRRRVASADKIGAFRAPPLDRVLFGKEGEEPDPDEVESPEGIASIANSLLAFGRKTRPLVFVFRGGEWIDKPLHDLLIQFARGAAAAPVCGFIFYQSANVEPWHVLSRVNREP